MLMFGAPAVKDEKIRGKIEPKCFAVFKEEEEEWRAKKLNSRLPKWGLLQNVLNAATTVRYQDQIRTKSDQDRIRSGLEMLDLKSNLLLVENECILHYV